MRKTHRSAALTRLGALSIFLAFAPSCSTANADASGKIPYLIIGPPSDSQIESMLASPNEWRSMRRRAVRIIHADHSFNDLSDETLRRWFTAMKSQHLLLELEVGAIKEWSPSADKTFEIERVIWDRINRLGGRVASIAMDEPLVASKALHKSEEYAIDETARFVNLVRHDFPNLQIGDIESFPYIPADDHVKWINSLNKRLVELGVPRLDFYRIDPDWNAFPAAGDWRGVKSITDYCRASGLRSSVIIWSARAAGHQKDDLLDHAWRDGVILEAGKIKANGIRPDQVVFESWINLPRKALPVSDSTTFTGSVEAALDALKE